MKSTYLITAKITLDVNNCLQFLYAAQELGNSLRVSTLSANPTKGSNTLKQFVGSLSVFDHFVKLVLKRLGAPFGV